MRKILKKHIGLLILLIILIAFPASMSTQARLNMRIIITGLAIDKTESGYEVTAQIVRTAPSSGAEKSGATIDFVTDTGDTIISAISKLSYKSGKVAGFSHTNFILLGKKMLDENLLKTLNYFLRDTLIKDSVLLLVAKESASDEIKKTKDVGLSVGLEIQKVFVYKEKESDGAMTSLISFVNKSLNESKTSVVSVLSMNADSKNNGQSGESSSGSTESQGESGGQQSSSGQQSSGSSSGSQESSGGQSLQSSQSSQNSSQSSGSEYFDAITLLACFVEGKYVGALESDDEIMGYMFAERKCTSEDISIKNVSVGKFNNAIIGIDVKNKKCKKKIRFEQDTPCLDICIKISNSIIREIQNEELIQTISSEEFDYIKDKVAEHISKTIAKTFEKSKELNADIFGAFDIANKFHYEKVKNKFKSMEEFLKALKLNVEVDVSRLEH